MTRFTSLAQSLKRGIILLAGLAIIPATAAMLPSVYDQYEPDYSSVSLESDSTYSVGSRVLLYDVSCMGGICTVDGEAPADYTIYWKPDGSQLLLWTYDPDRGTALDSAVVDSIWSDWGYTSPYAYAVNVPGTPPSDGLYTNEPSNFVQLTERGFSARGEDGWKGGDVDFDLDFSFGTVKPATASPDSYGIARYLAGAILPGHSLSPFNIYATSTTNIGEFLSDSLYVAYWFKVSDAWQGHNSTVNKILFITRENSTGAPFITSATGSDNSTLYYQLRTQGITSINRSGNQGAPDSIHRGQWYKIEHLLVLNTADGVADGVIKVWMDGVLTHHYTNGNFWAEALGLRYWAGIKWNPIWGGLNDSLEVEQYQYIDHIYVSGNDNS